MQNVVHPPRVSRLCSNLCGINEEIEINLQRFSDCEPDRELCACAGARSLASTYLHIPRCHIALGIIKLNPKTTVAHNIGLHWTISHRSSPSAHNVTQRCITSPKSRGVNNALAIFSWSAGWEAKCRLAAVRTKILRSPIRPQTCASWMTVTMEAFGRTEGGGMPAGHGAWVL